MRTGTAARKNGCSEATICKECHLRTVTSIGSLGEEFKQPDRSAFATHRGEDRKVSPHLHVASNAELCEYHCAFRAFLTSNCCYVF